MFNIRCAVDVIGVSSISGFTGLIDIVSQSSVKKWLNIGDKIINLESQYEQYRPLCVTGVLTEVFNDNVIPVKNTKISFIKNGFVVDYCITNEFGEYFVFLKNGIYDIRADGGKTRYFKNKKIDKGLRNLFYFNYKGNIKSKNKDLILLNNCNMLLFKGKFESVQDEKIELIFTQNNKIICYYETNNNGDYNFALEKGNYDLRIRKNNFPVEIINNFIVDENGFADNLIKNSAIFRRNWIESNY